MIEYELIKLAKVVNVGGNLREEQAREIAEALHEQYPNENIADFRTCFHRATMLHKYGDIFRLDAMVIAGWFTQYMEEKYEALEKEVHSFKDNPYQAPVKQESDPTFNLVKEFNKIHGDVVNKIPPLSPDRIKLEGQANPIRKDWTGHKSTKEEYVRKWHERQRELRIKFLKDKYPNATDEEINEMI